jgi:selenocysteine-specific elongation factor
MTHSSPIPHHVVLGMAGHIDHGKTSLVKALTGIDTDRLKEEKERGMTTDLGFAFLGDEIAIIDVPGHEKFVKTMVAGVNSVDLAMLVVAADDGIMPQTREHLEILKLLQVPAGLVALNKIDLAEPEWIELVKGELAALLRGTMLEGAPVIPVSALTGEGVERLRAEVRRIAKNAGQRRDKGVFRMPVDRVFSIKGFGTVVAGTVVSGEVHEGDDLELLPRRTTARVRGIQVHDQSVKASRIGLRTAVNLQGLEKELAERGDVLCAPGYFVPTSMADVRMSYLSSAPGECANRMRVRIHVGTSEVVSRLILLDREILRPGSDGLIQVHFERPVVVDAGDRFVVRSYSPVQTIGGGVVLDPHPTKHKRLNDEVLSRLKEMERGDPAMLTLEQLLRSQRGIESPAALAKAASIPVERVSEHLHQLQGRNLAARISADGWCAAGVLVRVRRGVLSLLEQFHRDHSLRLGAAVVEMHSRLRPPVDRRLFDRACAELAAESRIARQGERIALAGHEVRLTGEQQGIREKISAAFRAAPLTPPSIEEAVRTAGHEGEKVAAFMLESGELVRLEEGVVIHREGLDVARQKLHGYFVAHKQGTLSELRQHLGISRKYAVPIMTQLDAEGMTEREGDVRRLRKG